MASSNNTKKTTVGQIQKDVLEYTVGRDPELDLALAELDCVGTAAHVTMLSRLKGKARQFSASERGKIVQELVKTIKLIRAGKFEITMEDQDVHMAVERRLTDVCGELGKKVHTGRSRNDQVAVDLRLYGREQLLATIQELCLLANELMIHARNHQFVPMVGRTHMQPAMPSSVGLFMSAHVESLLDDLLLVINAFEMNDQCPLGSAAGYGVPLPIKRELTAELLGFSSVQHNVLYASTSRGKMESIILSALSQVMVSLSRLAQDLILYSMPEFGYFLLPEAYCTGSSIMPQKRNPDVLELVRAKACVVQGHYQAVTSMITSLPTGYNRDLQEAKGPFMDGFSITRSSLRICAGLISVLDIDEAALKNAFSPGVFATDLALEKVAAGMPFRDAYHQVKKELDTLADRDPAEAVAAKTHTGATAGLDLETIQNRVDAGLFFAQEEWQLHYRALSKLLDVEYPSLKKRRK